jgi:hypothetical protein
MELYFLLLRSSKMIEAKTSNSGTPFTLYPKTGVFVFAGRLQNMVMEVGPTFVLSLRLGRRGPENVEIEQYSQRN